MDRAIALLILRLPANTLLMKWQLILGLSLVTLSVVACSDDDDTNASTSSSASSSSAGQGGSSSSSSSASGSGGMAGGGGMAGAGGQGGMACEPPTGMFDKNGCLTFAGGSDICGSNSDDVLCNAALDCGVSTGNLDQCHIDCSQGMVVGECYTQEDIDCVHNAAVCDNSCPDLSACHWPFF